MSERRPPRLATWLLGYLGWDSKTESLIGDLREQYAEGRSPIWYWKQVQAAIFIKLATAAHEHGPSFIGAVAVAYIIVHFSGVPGALIWHEFVRTWGFYWQWPVWVGLPLDLFVVPLSAAFQLSAGWVVVRICHSHPRAGLAALVSVLAVSSLWMIIRDARGLAMQDLPGVDFLLRHYIDILLLLFRRAALPVAFVLTGGLLTLRSRSKVPGNTRLDWLVVTFALFVEAFEQIIGDDLPVLGMFVEPLWIAQLAALSYLAQHRWGAFAEARSGYEMRD